MRRASFTINGQGVEGHFALEQYNVGDLYQMRLSGKWMVVEKVHDGKFVTADGEGYFYKLRPATEAEVGEWLARPVGNVAANLDAWMQEPEY